MPPIFLRAAAALALAIVLAAGASAQPVALRGSGSTFLAPAIEAWAGAYAAGSPGATVSFRAVGSGDGIRDFMAGRTHFGATERPMRDEEIATVPEGVLHVPIAAGMVVVAYNLPGVTGLRLSRRTLVGVFTGAIRRWDDPRLAADNPGLVLPRRDIAIATRREASGTSFAFASHLAAIDPGFATRGPGVSQQPTWPPQAMYALGNEGVAALIGRSDYAIGYVEYGFASRLGIPVAVLENRAGAFVAPTPESGAASIASEAAALLTDGRAVVADPKGAASYPIATLVWFLLRERQNAPGVAQALRSFVDLALGQGQVMAAEIGYVPLPQSAVLQSKALAERVR
jgi:phosphate transport system substrate-binding protein